MEITPSPILLTIDICHTKILKKVTMTTFKITLLCFVIIGTEVDTYYLMKVICFSLFDGLNLERKGKEISIQFLC